MSPNLMAEMKYKEIRPLILLVLVLSFSFAFVQASAISQFEFTFSNIMNTTNVTTNGAIMVYTVSATNNGTAVSTISCDPVSGSLFAVGDNPVYCTATDSLGNSATASFMIIVTGIDIIQPTTTASPPGGTYGSTQLVVLTPSETATIYYTTDGTTPTTSSPVYSSPISISSTTTLKFFAKDPSGNTESVKTQNYVITSYPINHMQDTTATYGLSVYDTRPILAEFVSGTSQLVGDQIDTIVITLKKSGAPTGTAQIGVFNTDLSVKKLFGTKDATTLTTTYVAYTFALPANDSYQIVSGDRIGIKYNAGPSANSIAIMTDQDSADPFDGTSSYYTQYTTSWSPSSPSDLTMALKQTHNPPDSIAPITTPIPAPGTYTEEKTVTLNVNEPATIYYTTDGTTPTTSSPVYLNPIVIGTSTTLKFFAKDTSGNSETVKTAVYTINLPDTTIPTTTANPVGGTYGSAQSVTLSANEPATIYYTTDGTTPTTSSPVYSSPISISTTTTLKFFAKDTAGNTESPNTEVYTINTFPIIHMQDTTESSGSNVQSGRPIQAVYVSSASQLVGDKIDSITIKIRKTGSPTGTAQIGVFNTDLSVKKLFGTIDAATVNSLYTDYTFTLGSNQLYTIQAGDRIGIKFTGGNNKNRISFMLDQNSANPFDGTNSYLTSYTTSWQTFTNYDPYMILKQTHP